MNWLDVLGGLINGLIGMAWLAIITVLVAQTARRVLAFAAAALLVLEIMVPTGSLPLFRSLFRGWDRR